MFELQVDEHGARAGLTTGDVRAALVAGLAAAGARRAAGADVGVALAQALGMRAPLLGGSDSDSDGKRRRVG
jgi:hypothetical protein